jgi:hypothetical protein
MNQNLKETALLGTSKKQLDIAQFPNSIQKILSSQVNVDHESLLLQAISIDWYYNLAGNLPPKYDGPVEQRSFQEILNEAPLELLQLLNNLAQAQDSLQKMFLNAWVELLIQRNERVSYEYLLAFLKFAKVQQLKFPGEIIGLMGAWVCTQASEYQHLLLTAPKATENIWLEGTLSQRADFLRYLRSTSVLLSHECILQTWDTDAIQDKYAFLKIFSATLQAIDLPLLQQWYTQDFAHTAKEKKTQRLCRELLASMLLRLPESLLHKETVNIINSYTVQTSGKGWMATLVGKKRKVFNLPTEGDEFWDLSHFLKTFGVDDKYDLALYPRDVVYMFLSLWGHLPLNVWQNMLANEQVLEYLFDEEQFSTKIKGKEKTAIKESLKIQAINFKDEDLAYEVLKYTSFHNETEQLQFLELLGPVLWEKYIIENNLFLNTNYLRSNASTEQWTEAFGNQFIDAVVKHLLKNNNLYEYAFPQLLANRLNIKSLDFLLNIHTKHIEKLQHITWWEKHFYQPLNEALTFRTTLEKFKQ